MKLFFMRMSEAKEHENIVLFVWDDKNINQGVFRYCLECWALVLGNSSAFLLAFHWNVFIRAYSSVYRLKRVTAAKASISGQIVHH